MTSQFPFQPQQRLLTKQDFQSIFDGASLRIVLGELLLLANANDLGFSRLGVITPKKILRHAVARNRVKRICRDYFRLQQHSLLVDKHLEKNLEKNLDKSLDSNNTHHIALDIVVLSRSGLAELSNVQLKEKLEHGFAKLIRVGKKYL